MAIRNLDVCGEICPDPLTLTLEAMKGLAVGDSLKVTIDSPMALETISRWAAKAGHKVVRVFEPEPGKWEITIEKAGGQSDF